MYDGISIYNMINSTSIYIWYMYYSNSIVTVDLNFGRDLGIKKMTLALTPWSGHSFKNHQHLTAQGPQIACPSLLYGFLFITARPILYSFVCNPLCTCNFSVTSLIVGFFIKIYAAFGWDVMPFSIFHLSLFDAFLGHMSKNNHHRNPPCHSWLAISTIENHRSLALILISLNDWSSYILPSLYLRMLL